jgi:UDP-N-acetylglucosamine 3-dehydrogenase
LNSNILGIGVIGIGYWGRKLVAEYLAMSKKRDDVRLRCIIDSSKERLASVASEYGLPRDMLDTDLSRAIRDPSVQAVHVATPNETHFTIGMAVLESHRHLMLEKPMSLNTREAVKLARKAEVQSVMLHVGHIFRFNNAVSEARKLIAKGAIGKPLYYNLAWEALIKPPEGRDIIFDLGPHPVDALNYLSDEWPTRVLALGKSFVRKRRGQEEMAQAFAEFEDDVLAHISLSWLYSGPKRRQLSITGDSGTIEVDALCQHVYVYADSTSRNCPVTANNTIESMISHFADSILEGGPPQNSALTGVMTVGVLSGMKTSVRTGRFVSMFRG